MTDSYASVLRNNGGGIDAQIQMASNDPLALASSDHPGAQLVTTIFNRTNFISWTRNVKMALGAKLKLGFIDGSTIKPAGDSPQVQRWIRADYMVRCWIVNSMESSIGESFMHAGSARDLWSEIVERYGHSNAPLLYQLKKSLSSVKQGLDPIGVYYGKLVKLWNELATIAGVPHCGCGALDKCTCQVIKKVLDMEDTNKTMQFLMGLNEEYEPTRNQILAMDSLPNVNRAFHIAQQVEQCGGIPGGSTSSRRMGEDATALNAGRQQTGNWKKDKDSRKQREDFKQCDFCGNKGHVRDTCYKLHGPPKCDFCSNTGHLRDKCYKLHGYPDKEKGSKEKQYGRSSANAVDIQNCSDSPIGSSSEGSFDGALVNAVCKEVLRQMKGKQIKAENDDCFAAANFSGPFH